MGWLVNNELERKWEAMMWLYFRYYPGICLKKLRKTVKTLS
jgi:hypothetical protein